MNSLAYSTRSRRLAFQHAGLFRDLARDLFGTLFEMVAVLLHEELERSVADFLRPRKLEKLTDELEVCAAASVADRGRRPNHVEVVDAQGVLQRGELLPVGQAPVHVDCEIRRPVRTLDRLRIGLDRLGDLSMWHDLIAALLAQLVGDEGGDGDVRLLGHACEHGDAPPPGLEITVERVERMDTTDRRESEREDEDGAKASSTAHDRHPHCFDLETQI